MISVRRPLISGIVASPESGRAKEYMSFITQEDARKFSAPESLILPQLARIVCFYHISVLCGRTSSRCAVFSYEIFINGKPDDFFADSSFYLVNDYKHFEK